MPVAGFTQMRRFPIPHSPPTVLLVHRDHGWLKMHGFFLLSRPGLGSNSADRYSARPLIAARLGWVRLELSDADGALQNTKVRMGIVGISNSLLAAGVYNQ